MKNKFMAHVLVLFCVLCPWCTAILLRLGVKSRPWCSISTKDVNVDLFCVTIFIYLCFHMVDCKIYLFYMKISFKVFGYCMPVIQKYLQFVKIDNYADVKGYQNCVVSSWK